MQRDVSSSPPLTKKRWTSGSSWSNMRQRRLLFKKTPWKTACLDSLVIELKYSTTGPTPVFSAKQVPIVSLRGFCQSKRHLLAVISKSKTRPLYSQMSTSPRTVNSSSRPILRQISKTLTSVIRCARCRLNLAWMLMRCHQRHQAYQERHTSSIETSVHQLLSILSSTENAHSILLG